MPVNRSLVQSTQSRTRHSKSVEASHFQTHPVQHITPTSQSANELQHTTRVCHGRTSPTAPISHRATLHKELRHRRLSQTTSLSTIAIELGCAVRSFSSESMSFVSQVVLTGSFHAGADTPEFIAHVGTALLTNGPYRTNSRLLLLSLCTQCIRSLPSGHSLTDWVSSFIHTVRLPHTLVFYTPLRSLSGVSSS